MTRPRLPRVGAREKVTGAAKYGADHAPDGVAYAMPVVATVGKGRITDLDVRAATAVPGVLLVLSHLDDLGITPAGYIMAGGYAFQSLQPMLDDRVAYRGQPVALVVADTLVAATEAAGLVRVTYDTEPFAVEVGAAGTETVLQEEALPLPFLADVVVGDAEAAYAASPVRVDQSYRSGPQHQVPMELIGGVVEWQGDTVVVHEGTQSVGALRGGLAGQLGIDRERVEVISPYVGGAFGQKNSLQPHLGPLAVAARRIGRPVKLVLPRAHTFHAASFRPVARHRIRLGADRAGRLLAAIHEVDQQASRQDLLPATYTEITSRLYAIPDFRGRQRHVRTDTQTPGYMRAPFEHSAAFALESAIDELCHVIGRDPVALRLDNDAATDPVTGKPFSSRHLGECLRLGAELFGWADRTPEPGSMRDEDGALIGWGVAVGAYPSLTVPTQARLRAYADGRLVAEVGGHEMGQGITTALTCALTEDLGIVPEAVTVVVGDTRAVPHHLTAGAWGTNSTLRAAHEALRELRAALGLAPEGPVDLAAAVTASGRDPVEVEVVTQGPGQPPEMIDRMRAGLVALAGPDYPGYVSFSFVAHFAEVRIEPVVHRVRVPRVVSVADCGRVASPVTAEAQVRGSVVWGIGAALREHSEVDPRYGGFLNTDLAEYVIPVNADIGRIDVAFVDRPDHVLNPMGAKSLGEVALVGMAAAVANAVHHATGRRVRHLPIMIEDVM
ncbi:xanthine dehydrogenase family protein molybdopterin-binding subunit [Nonomuraea sp. NPDC050643]|uniref:xanthine dehydrogenase family protein molybdopterin-binding subunit n=1 Tax=Nonomuraea sp. NPDC050643 TaxID=3155660 RepID=UPI0033F796E1